MSPALPEIVIVGRPNVGKSTLVNRILGRRETIVEERPGVTRDRKGLPADWAGYEFTLVDTGGWMAAGDELDAKVTGQAERAIDSAAVVLLVVDATVGLTDEDERVAALLRRSGRPAIVVVNKVDSQQREADIWDFLRLGLGDPWAVSALHGRGAGDLLDHVVGFLPETADRDTDAPATEQVSDMPAVAIVGRPNVGKSTLFNSLLGDDRSIVHDRPGTTRDTIDTIVESPDGPVRLLDTAGLRRKSRIDSGPEYFSLVRAFQAIDGADAAILVVDATEGVTHQDQRLAERIDASGSPVVIALNKWDAVATEHREGILIDVADRLGFIGYAPVLKISAKTKLGIHKLLPALDQAIDAYHRRVPTRELNKVIAEAQASHPPPGGKVLYATQGASDPPTFTLFTTKVMPATYLRYLEHRIRDHFGFGPTPLKLRVRRRGA